MYLPFRIGLLLALLSAVNSSFVHEFLKKFDIKRALNTASEYELIEEVVDKLCKEFPELKPTKQGEIILLKRQFAYFVNATAAEQEDALSGSPPTKFGLINAKFMQFRKIAKREIPNLSSTVQAMVVNADGFMLYKIVGLLQDFVAKWSKIDADARSAFGWAGEEIRGTIESRKLRLVDSWHEDDPLHSRYAYLQARVQHRTRAAMMFFKKKKDKRSAAYELVRTGNYTGVMEYTSPHELAETIVDKLLELYPELEMPDEIVKKLLKLQVAWLITAEKSVRKKVLNGRLFMDEFLELLIRYEELTDVAVEAFERLLSWQQHSILKGDPQKLKRRLVLLIVLDHLEAKMASYEQRGISEEQRKEEIRLTDARLKEEWSSEPSFALILPDVLMAMSKEERKAWKADKERKMMEEMEKWMDEEKEMNANSEEKLAAILPDTQTEKWMEEEKQKKPKSRVDREKRLKEQLEKLERRAMNAMEREEL